MSKQSLLILATIFVWLLIVCVDGFLQIKRGVSLDGYGYETQWQFQLQVFLATRFIIYLLALAGIIAGIWWFSRKNS